MNARKDYQMTENEQTELLDRLRTRMQSIAIQAVEVQDKLGNFDTVFDVLTDIEHDIMAAIKINTKLMENK